MILQSVPIILANTLVMFSVLILIHFLNFLTYVGPKVLTCYWGGCLGEGGEVRKGGEIRNLFHTMF